MHLFRDRTEAGQLLGRRLAAYAGRRDVIVLALPRGGVPVGFEVARALRAPLDIFLVRKLGVPGHEELAMGAIASGGVLILQEDVVHDLGISRETIEGVALRESDELLRREKVFRDERPAPAVRNRTVILADDGLATGATMQAAIAALRRHEPERIIAAVPVAAPSSCEDLRADVDEMVCLETPEPFYAVGLWYQDFPQISDDEVRELLARAGGEQARPASPSP